MRLLAVHANVVRTSPKRSLKEALATEFGICFLKVLVWSVPLVACTHKGLDENSVEVIPQVYEGRQDEPGRVLIVQDGHSLNLRRASVLAKKLLLRDITEEGVHDKYVDGAHYEANLYEDTSKKASLFIEPLPGGDYHIVGLLNYTHRIEPLVSMARSGRTVHRVSQLANNHGTCDAIGVVGAQLYGEAYSATEARTLPGGFAMELYLITDYVHTRPFGKRDKQRVQYATALMHSVSLRMQQLDPPGSIIITAIQASFTITEPYVHLLGKDLVGMDTMKLLQQHIQTNQSMLQSDIVFMLTGRDMISVVNGSKSFALAGLAYTGHACRSHKVGVAEDKPRTFSGVQYVAHEIGHLLGSPHDGHGSSTKCSGADGYMMSPTAGGEHSVSFSQCSKDAINTFLRWNGSVCLKTNTNPEVIVLPSNTAKLPGELLNGAQFCVKHYSTYKNVTYVKHDSDLRRCKIRCQLGPRIQRLKDALDGTPCDSTHPEMKCKEGVCRQW